MTNRVWQVPGFFLLSFAVMTAMDDHLDHPTGFADRWHALPAAHRHLLIAVGVAAVVAAVWLGGRPKSSSQVLALNSEIVPAAALAHLHERGLTTARLNEAGKLCVPADRLAEANGWIEEFSAFKTSWADEWEKSNSKLGQFSGSRERDTAREITRARMIGRLLRQMPGIAQADIIWDEEEATGWRQPQKTRCTVYLRPKSGFEITPDVAQSVRQAVAGSKKNLDPGDIVVMDLGRMATFDAVPNGVDESQRTDAERQIAEMRRDIESALRQCPGVRVNVGVTWRNDEAGEKLVSLSQNTANERPRPMTRLVADSPSPDSTLTPEYQVTISAPEAAATRWASKIEDKDEKSSETAVTPASFETGARPRGAAASIRHSVSAVLDRYGKGRIPAAVAVHLTPTSSKISRMAMRELTQASAIDPLWFIALAGAACLIGAWALSAWFGNNAATTASLALVDEAARYASPAFNPPQYNEPSWTDAEESVTSSASNSFAEFEDLIHGSDELWNRLWEACPLETWTNALKGASLQLRREAFLRLPEYARQPLRIALEQATPPRLGDIDTCQGEILEAARRIG
jgi:hypothetical protein